MRNKITLVDTSGKETTHISPRLGSIELKSTDGVVCVEKQSLLGTKDSYCVVTNNRSGKTNK